MHHPTAAHERYRDALLQDIRTAEFRLHELYILRLKVSPMSQDFTTIQSKINVLSVDVATKKSRIANIGKEPLGMDERSLPNFK